jgi:hypothetical protein
MKFCLDENWWKRTVSSLNSVTRKRRHKYISNTIITTLRFLELLIKSTRHSILRISIFGVEFTKYVKNDNPLPLMRPYFSDKHWLGSSDRAIYRITPKEVALLFTRRV